METPDPNVLAALVTRIVDLAGGELYATRLHPAAVILSRAGLVDGTLFEFSKDALRSYEISRGHTRAVDSGAISTSWARKPIRLIHALHAPLTERARAQATQLLDLSDQALRAEALRLLAVQPFLLATQPPRRGRPSPLSLGRLLRALAA